MTEVRAYVVNISEGGIAIVTAALLKPGIEVRVECMLPGYESPFVADSTICWYREGHIGLQFISLSVKVRAKLHNWLARSLEKCLPDSVAFKFQALTPSCPERVTPPLSQAKQSNKVHRKLVS
jgi:PilZ domain